MEIQEVKDESVRTFRVSENGKEIAQVWYSNGKARCVECSGALVAMSASCRHARAVARYVKKQGVYKSKIL